jgi:hypothetical protein
MKLKEILVGAVYRGYSPIWWIRKCFLILFNFREYSERKKWKPVQPSDESYVRNLNQEGFSVIKFDELQTSGVIDACLALSQKIDPLDEAPPESEGKDFWRLLVSGEEAKSHPIMLSFAHSPHFKSLASNYLGQEAVLSNVTLMKSYPIKNNPTHSQLWHLDADDARLVVFYLYINDVSSSNGPFELIPKSAMKYASEPRYFRRYGMSDARIKKYISDFSPKSLTGASGTIFACDTATIYHRGSRCESSIRLALSFRYQTFTGLYPFKAL